MRKKLRRLKSDTEKIGWTTLLLSMFFPLLGLTCGWGLTWETGDEQAFARFIKFCTPAMAAMLACQVIIFRAAQRRLLFRLFFFGLIVLGLALFPLCIYLPFFWMDEYAPLAKLAMLQVIVVVFVANCIHGVRVFNAAWTRVGHAEFEKQFDPRVATLDWASITRKMAVDLNIHLPGVSGEGAMLVAVASFAGMLILPFFRPIFPSVVLFSLGMPFTLAAAYFVQLAAFGFAQMFQVRKIEKQYGITLKA